MNEPGKRRKVPTLHANAVGIVVQSGTRAIQRPRAVAFVWGGKVRGKPSLPYGRWKPEVVPAV